jgi:hypothetical protein
MVKGQENFPTARKVTTVDSNIDAIHAAGAASSPDGLLGGALCNIEPTIMPTMKASASPRIIATIRSVAVRGDRRMPSERG